MPFIKEKFPTYDLFAKASLDNIYGEHLGQAPVQLYANEFASVILVNQGNGQFEKDYLPREAQVSPLLAIVTHDLNEDGVEDLILGGNIYDTEVETPRWDAGRGLVLLNQDGRYCPQPIPSANLQLSGNVKDLAIVTLGERTFLLATKNGGTPEVRELTR